MKTKTIQLKQDKKNEHAVKEKIKELKKELNRNLYDNVGILYGILQKIVILRQSTNPKYKARSLEWEDGIDLTAMQIRYIFSYQYISSYALKKVQEGKITSARICHFLAISSLLREVQWQNKLIDLILTDKIKVSQVSELTKEELKKFLLGKLDLREDDAYFMTATKTLRSITKRLHERKSLLKSSPYSINLRNAVKKLYEEVKGNE